MTYIPNEAEVEAFRLAFCESPYELNDFCRWMMIHYEPRIDEQRCDGSGSLFGRVMMGDPGPAEQRCPGCSRCRPEATPKATSQSVTVEADRKVSAGSSDGFGNPIGSPAASGSTAESISGAVSPAADARPSAAPVGVESLESIAKQGIPQRAPLLIELGQTTLRALMAAIMGLTERAERYNEAALAEADELLAELAKPEVK